MALQGRVNEETWQLGAIPGLELLRNRLLNSEPTNAEDLTDVGEAGVVSVPTSKHQLELNSKENSEFEVSQSVAKMFESTKGWREHGAAELAMSLESLERMQMAIAALAPVRAFCEQMRSLDDGFRPLRTFETQIGELAESYPAMKAFHKAISSIVEESGASFVQLAESMEVVNESRKQIARLASTLEGAAELQTELNKLAQAFSKQPPTEVSAVPHAA